MLPPVLLADNARILTRSDYLEAALRYLRMGWRPIPLQANKRPACRKWAHLQDEPFTESLVRKLFATRYYDIHGVATFPGPLSNNLAVRDFDSEKAAEAWLAGHRHLASYCPLVRSRRGIHVYFRLPDGHPGGWEQHPDGSGELFANSKHLVVLPPTLHPKGVRYTWIQNEPTSSWDLPILDPVPCGLASGPEWYLTPKQRGLQSPPRRTPSGSVSVKITLTPTPLRYCVSFFEMGSKFDRWQEAVERCIPGGPGQRERCLWRFAYLLKSLPDFAGYGPWRAEAAFDHWLTQSAPFIRTRNRETNWKAFCRAWSRVRIASEAPGVHTAAIRAFGADKAPTKPKGTAAIRAAILELGRELAKDDGLFYLSCRDTADKLGISQKHAARHLKGLVTDGQLQLVQSGQYADDGKVKRQASVYRMAGVASCSRMAEPQAA